eukprot:m.16745 g.16745  ORF g.16745 m.16745 type:complete len:267 (+) comp10706_c0_seq1:32-832(+)
MSWDTEDWSLQLAEEGATKVSMHDLNAGAPEEIRKAKEALLEARRQHLAGVAGDREKLKAVEEIKKSQAEARQQNKLPEVPAGWKRIPTRARPGEFIYENTLTGERQAWLPCVPAVDYEKVQEEAAVVKKKGPLTEEQKQKNREALEKRHKKTEAFLPEGWKKVPSSSKKGEYVYENMYTEERIAWFPSEPASKKALPEQAPKPGKAVEKALALFPYTALTAEEIDLDSDDIILVEHKAPSGWWVGTNTRTGKMGLFPGSFASPVG